AQHTEASQVLMAADLDPAGDGVDRSVELQRAVAIGPDLRIDTVEILATQHEGLEARAHSGPHPFGRSRPILHAGNADVSVADNDSARREGLLDEVARRRDREAERGEAGESVVEILGIVTDVIEALM